jgi:hypothetical protein
LSDYNYFLFIKKKLSDYNYFYLLKKIEKKFLYQSYSKITFYPKQNMQIHYINISDPTIATRDSHSEALTEVMMRSFGFRCELDISQVIGLGYIFDNIMANLGNQDRLSDNDHVAREFAEYFYNYSECDLCDRAVFEVTNRFRRLRETEIAAIAKRSRQEALTRLEEEARLSAEEEEHRLVEEARRRVEEARRIAEEARLADDVRTAEENLLGEEDRLIYAEQAPARRAEEARRIAEEESLRAEAARHRVEEARRRGAEALRLYEEARRRDEEARRLAPAANTWSPEEMSPDVFDDCSICMGKPCRTETTKTTCGHVFCTVCLEEWFKASNKRSCPYCRGDL